MTTLPFSIPNLCIAWSVALTPATLEKDALHALGERQYDRALALASEAIDQDAALVDAYRVRAEVHYRRRDRDKYPDAIADLTRAIANGASPDLVRLRGDLNFMSGRFRDAVADFDAFLKRHPESAASDWKRGIACYYAGAYDEGRKQFERYQTFDDADFENAIWRFLCMARKDGLVAAQKGMLKIGDDRRVPMREIYELYLGKRRPDDVLAAAAADAPPAVANRQRFYAHLYLGLWFDLVGEPAKALEHLDRATDRHRIEHYMWDVARIHRERLAADRTGR